MIMVIEITLGFQSYARTPDIAGWLCHIRASSVLSDGSPFCSCLCLAPPSGVTLDHAGPVRGNPTSLAGDSSGAQAWVNTPVAVSRQLVMQERAGVPGAPNQRRWEDLFRAGGLPFSFSFG